VEGLTYSGLKPANAVLTSRPTRKDPPSQVNLLLWQDVRARAIDQHLDADRRAVGERVAELFRWLFLVVFAAAINLNGLTSTALVSDGLLVVWTGLNVGQTVLVLRGHRPSHAYSVATLGLDIVFGGVLLHLAGIGSAVALIVVGALLCRRMSTSMWAVWLWAGASLSIAALARQPYAHYLTAAAAPVALVLAGLPIPSRIRAFEPLRILRVAPLVAGVLFAAVPARIAGLDWIPEAAPSPAINATRTLLQYYGGAVATVVRSQAATDWDACFDWRVAADQAVVTWVGQQGLAGATAVVWSSEVWVYTLANLPVLVPTPPIYNDEVLLGGDSGVASFVAGLRPTLIIVTDDAVQNWPGISRLLDGTTYHRVLTVSPEAVWARADLLAP
jgi:hypothetical protein